MSNLRSESEVLDLEKGKGSDPKTASASPAEDEDTELVTDPRKACLINFVVAGFCVAAIVAFVYSVYSMYNGTVSFWEAFGYCAVFVICAVSVGTVLMVRKALISKFAPVVAAAAATVARPVVAAAATTVARPVVAAAATTLARPAATTTAARRPLPVTTNAARPPCPAATTTAARPDDNIETIDPLEVLFALP